MIFPATAMKSMNNDVLEAPDEDHGGKTSSGDVELPDQVEETQARTFGRWWPRRRTRVHLPTTRHLFSGRHPEPTPSSMSTKGATSKYPSTKTLPFLTEWLLLAHTQPTSGRNCLTLLKNFATIFLWSNPWSHHGRDWGQGHLHKGRPGCGVENDARHDLDNVLRLGCRKVITSSDPKESTCPQGHTGCQLLPRISKDERVRCHVKCSKTVVTVTSLKAKIVVLDLAHRMIPSWLDPLAFLVL